ncbi:Uncharacterised protein [Mycobacterium tuberculosis]|nr:Uncharacterised protein [Mycobacterium tuberculosis]
MPLRVPPPPVVPRAARLAKAIPLSRPAGIPFRAVGSAPALELKVGVA